MNEYIKLPKSMQMAADVQRRTDEILMAKVGENCGYRYWIEHFWKVRSRPEGIRGVEK